MEEIKADPAELYDRVCEFLGVRPASAEVLPMLAKNVNTTQKYSAPMPDEVKLYLARTLLPKIEDAAGLLGSYAEGWLANTRKLLADG